MVIGALVTMAFFFAYTQVRTAVQNVAFTCIINFCLNIYYGTLYAYTPEVLPSAHRGTGNGIAIGWNRVMGILSAVIATVADVSLFSFFFLLTFLFFHQMLGMRILWVLSLTWEIRLELPSRYTFVRRCISLWR